MRKLPARFQPLVMRFVLSGMMSALVSGISTLRLTGVKPHFPAEWLQAWGPSWVIAFLALMVAMPLAAKLVGLIVAPPPEKHR